MNSNVDLVLPAPFPFTDKSSELRRSTQHASLDDCSAGFPGDRVNLNHVTDAGNVVSASQLAPT